MSKGLTVMCFFLRMPYSLYLQAYASTYVFLANLLCICNGVLQDF